MGLRNFFLGVHVSISGGVAEAVLRAVGLKCTTFQIFPSNPRGWYQKPYEAEDVALFRERYQAAGFRDFFIHMPYLPNIASPDEDLYERSVAALIDAVERAAVLGGRYVVTHMGSHKGAGLAEGQERAAAALCRALASTRKSGVMILMEDSAGKAHQVGTKFTELAALYRRVPPACRPRVGLCVDTCHSHAMGYDLAPGGDGLERILAEVEDGFGLDKIKLIHLNDAKGPAGSMLDRHEHIGLGTIGKVGFRKIINHPLLRDVPMVLETPQEDDWDKRNLRTVRRLRDG